MRDKMTARFAGVKPLRPRNPLGVFVAWRLPRFYAPRFDFKNATARSHASFAASAL
jgi:hypothetical protein